MSFDVNQLILDLATRETRFDSFFKDLLADFGERNLSYIQCCKESINWPKKAYGVYTIWQEEICYDNLIYVGLTGKYSRDKNGLVNLNGGTFASRKTRWTPYKFCEKIEDGEFQYYFRYGPTYGSHQRDNQHKIDAYSSSISYEDLRLLLFNLADMSAYSSSLLESLILTRYYQEDGKLPPANNEL